eukprot:scaffold2448_cov119-Isochrysis_galbana.AAC.11
MSRRRGSKEVPAQNRFRRCRGQSCRNHRRPSAKSVCHEPDRSRHPSGRVQRPAYTGAIRAPQPPKEREVPDPPRLRGGSGGRETAPATLQSFCGNHVPRCQL